MATFTSTIHLEDADKSDYENLFTRLEKQVLKRKYQIAKGKQYDDGKREFRWRGNISIQEITNAIFQSLSGSGKKFSFTVIRKKLVAG